MRVKRKLTPLESVRDFTRLELRQAAEAQQAVQRYLVRRDVGEVAELIGLPKALVGKLQRDDAGVLLDYILWQRRHDAKVDSLLRNQTKGN